MTAPEPPMAPSQGPAPRRTVHVRFWAVVLVVMAVLVVAPQPFVAAPLSETCPHSSSAPFPRYERIEWRWAPFPGLYCVWTEADGDRRSGYALL